jgi:hypothetical protein
MKAGKSIKKKLPDRQLKRHSSLGRVYAKNPNLFKRLDFTSFWGNIRVRTYWEGPLGVEIPRFEG